jgi:nanoRNase/pAp phosphatase (c-di-AMP/oligoRNAs hydrolase)
MLKQILHRFSSSTDRFDLVSLPPAGQRIFELLTNDYCRTHSYIITTYRGPDLDGIAAAVALSEFLTKRLNYTNCRAMITLEPQIEPSWVMSKLSFDLPQLNKIDKTDEFILVDVSDAASLADSIPYDQVKIVIDHRSYGKIEPFKKLEGVWIEEMGSAATLIALLLRHAKYEPSHLAANLVYLAILSNTINCKSHNTKLQDVSALAWLEQYITVDDTFVDEMFRAKSIINDIEWTIDYDLPSKLVAVQGKQTAVG